VPSDRPISSAIAVNTSACDASRATSVATRRRAACSRASRATSARVSALAIDVLTRSVNCATRASVSGASGPGCFEWTARAPQTRPATTIGQPTVELTPISSRMNAAIGLASSLQSSQRAARLASAIVVAGSPGCICQRSGKGGNSPTAAQPDTVTTSPSSKRAIPAKSAPSRVPTSCATAWNSSLDGTSSATSVATRRSAACSAASRAASSLASLFAIAVATSSVKSVRRASVSCGRMSGSSEDTTMTPHRRPATTIGIPTLERIPTRLHASAIIPSRPR
jgi:hypothetical protein